MERVSRGYGLLLLSGRAKVCVGKRWLDGPERDRERMSLDHEKIYIYIYREREREREI
jgi:hypothetical protein